MIVQSREQKRLDELRAVLVKEGADVSRLHGVVGDFQSEAEARAVADKVGQVGRPQHIISILGFITPIATLPSETTPEQLQANWSESVWPTMRAQRALLPLVKGRAGTSYTQLSGGLAHGLYVGIGAWAATAKNGFLNTLAQTLTEELKDDGVAFHNVCLHFGVAKFGDKVNQLGMPASDTRDFGVLFPALARADKNRGTICVENIEHVQKIVKEYPKQ